MDALPSEIEGVKKGVAVLTACLAAALAETDPAFGERLTARIDEAYARVRDGGDLHTLELLTWTRTLLTGFDRERGRSAPFFED